MIKVYHILSHTLEPLYPSLRKDIKGFSQIEHTINKFVQGLIQQDKGNRFEHIVILPSSSITQQQLELTHKDGYTILLVKTFSWGFPFEYSPYLKRIIKGLHDGIIHVYGTGSFLYDYVAPALKNKPSIAHYMGGHFTWKFFPISFIKYNIIQYFTLHYPTILFIQNKIRIEKYHKQYNIPYQKMIFVPVAIDEGLYNTNNKKKNLGDSVKLLFVGRLEVAKGLQDLISVYQRLMKKYHNITLSIAGNGSLKKWIQKITQKNTKIQYLGQLNSHELIKTYQEHDIVVLPTHFDCFPSVLVEAGAMGLPSISTNVEGPLSIIQDGKTGSVVPVGDHDKLYDSIAELIENKEKRELFGKNAKQLIHENFTLEKVSDIYFDTYTTLASLIGKNSE